MSPFKNVKGFISDFASAIRGEVTADTSETEGIEKENIQSFKSFSMESTTSRVYTPGNGYVYHIFTQPGKFIVYNSGYVDMMLVAGGGGGGGADLSQGQSSYKCYGGGGGGGGVVHKYNIFLNEEIYGVIVGGGGSGRGAQGFSELNQRNDGGDSIVYNNRGNHPDYRLSVIAYGGGAGGTGYAPRVNGNPGGSGGGGASLGTPTANPYPGEGGTGIAGQGCDGSAQVAEEGNSAPDAAVGCGGGALTPGRSSDPPYVPLGGGCGAAAFGGDDGIPIAYGEILNPATTLNFQSLYTSGHPNADILPGARFFGGGAGSFSRSGGLGGAALGNPSPRKALRSSGGGGGYAYLSNPSPQPTYEYGGTPGAPGIVIIRYKV